ncbi:hypothetical protein PHYBOEH_011158 [Phytophthora boehmeriae]|uniref:Trichohyalin-plectin-homology domain-containing protein n=1 Tax=Phytophthora boehmeriae TaxID=109152 RepID=A0A8T1VIP9_9STRA|nr:hypothetical protein PHYBOEH_011158 [Phytophthora boehmeriae]
MVATSGGIMLTPAQRNLVEKSRAVKQQRAAALAAQLHVEASARAHVQEIKARRQGHNAPAPGTRRLILRHVGEELARVAQRERLVSSTALHSNNNNRQSLRSAASSRNEPQQVETNYSDDGYDEERFGSVRRPPRKQPPNLWVPIFERELAEVQRAKDEAEAKRLADAAEYRKQLAQQEAEKRSKRLSDKAIDDSYARAQAAQQAEWKEQEKAKQLRRQEHVALETQHRKQELRAQTEALRVAQEKKQRSERRTIERLRQLDEDDKRRKAERKAADMAEVVRVKQANTQQLELKRQAVFRDQQEDLELQKAYEKRLAFQEAARQAELDAVLAKQSQKVKLALLNVKSAEEKAHEDELRAQAVQAVVRAREVELLEQKDRKKREAARAQVRALTIQKEEKKLRLHELEHEEAAYASGFKADYYKWQQEQSTTRDKLHQRNRDYQQLVRQQMRDDTMRRKDEDKYGMTLVEAQLNTKLLQNAGIDSPPRDMHIR